MTAGVGLATNHLDLRPAGLGFAIAVSVLSLIALATLVIHRHARSRLRRVRRQASPVSRSTLITSPEIVGREFDDDHVAGVDPAMAATIESNRNGPLPTQRGH
ncbi:MAG: hypothetical protein JSR56_00780 [Proteobacteria bacterium]|nr:hypothetical protein [Pseudomonadota bacterium]